MTIVSCTHAAEHRNPGQWRKIGVIAQYDDPVTQELPSEAYPIAQFRYHGDATLYAKSLAERLDRGNNPPVAVLIF